MRLEKACNPGIQSDQQNWTATLVSFKESCLASEPSLYNYEPMLKLSIIECVMTVRNTASRPSRFGFYVQEILQIIAAEIHECRIGSLD